MLTLYILSRSIVYLFNQFYFCCFNIAISWNLVTAVNMGMKENMMYNSSRQKIITDDGGANLPQTKPNMGIKNTSSQNNNNLIETSNGASVTVNNTAQLKLTTIGPVNIQVGNIIFYISRQYNRVAKELKTSSMISSLNNQLFTDMQLTFYVEEEYSNVNTFFRREQIW